MLIYDGDDGDDTMCYSDLVPKRICQRSLVNFGKNDRAEREGRRETYKK